MWAAPLKDKSAVISVAIHQGWLQTLILFPPTPSNHTKGSSLNILQKGFVCYHSCYEQPIMRCLHCSHICDYMTSSPEVTSYKFLRAKVPMFSKLPARQRGNYLNRFVYSQPSACISGDPTKFLSWWLPNTIRVSSISTGWSSR